MKRIEVSEPLATGCFEVSKLPKGVVYRYEPFKGHTYRYRRLPPEDRGTKGPCPKEP